MSMQYTAWVAIAGVMVPVTNSTLGMEPNPQVIEDTVHGGTQGNPASNSVSPINYAQGNVKFSGDISFHMHDEFADTILGVCIDNRDTYFEIIQDDAVNKFTYPYCKVRSLRLTANVGGTLDCVMSVEGLSRTLAAHTSSLPASFTATTTGNLNTTPIPFWETTFAVGTPLNITSRMVRSWEITINNNTFVLQTATGDRFPVSLQQGQQTATANCVYYPVAVGTPPADTAVEPFTEAADTSPPEGGAVTVTMGTKTLNIPSTLLTSFPRPITGPNNKPFRTMAFTCFGDTTHGAVYTS